MKSSKNIFTLSAFLLLSISLLVFNSCIKELEFETEQLDQLFVFDGTLDNRVGTQKLLISRTGEFGKQVFEPVTGGNVVLKNDIGDSWAYEEFEAGSYYLFDFAGEVGRSYHIEGLMPNGKTYKSKPEKMHPPIPIEELIFDFGTEEFNQENGNISDIGKCNIFAQLRLPVSEEGVFVKWQTENIYQFTGLPNAFNVFMRCFIPGELDRQGIAVLSSNLNTSGAPILKKVSQKGMDWTFNETQYFNVTQSSISEEAFLYWQKIDRVTNDVGTLFDAPPASVIGNMINESDPELPVLGYFRVESSVIERIKVNPNQIPIQIPAKYCGLNRLSSPSECSNCLGFPNSTEMKPSWWE